MPNGQIHIHNVCRTALVDRLSAHGLPALQNKNSSILGAIYVRKPYV